MKLVKLTPSRKGVDPHYVSADRIVGLERSMDETIVYTSLRGWYLRVRETPEEIEALCNSEANVDPSPNDLLKFLRWFEHNRTSCLGRTHAETVHVYVKELRKA